MTRWLTKACTGAAVGAESDHRVTAGSPVMLSVMHMNRFQLVWPCAVYMSMALLCSGCGDADRTPMPAPSVQHVERKDQAQFHPAETAAEQFVSMFSGDELPNPLPTIPELRKLDDDARDESLQTLQQYLRSQHWTLWFTEIVVSGGQEDVADCYFKGSKDEHLVLGLAFHKNTWIVTTYEIPAKPFARVHGETMEEYVSEMVAEAKEQGEPYHNGTLADGLYLLEH